MEEENLRNGNVKAPIIYFCPLAQSGKFTDRNLKIMLYLCNREWNLRYQDKRKCDVADVLHSVLRSLI